MKLLNGLYKITADSAGADGGSHSYHLELNAGHFIYGAHFPGEPITPGVCILQIAKELLEIHLGVALAVDVVRNVKFLRIITPTETPRIVYTLQKVSFDGECAMCQAVVGDSSETYAKLSIVCRKQG